MSRHSFDPVIAKQVGLNAAVIFQNILFWCEKNAANERNIHDEKVWTYNSMTAFEKLFPYLSYDQIRGALAKLEDADLIEVGNYNTDARDRTKWYCVKSQTHLGKIPDTSGENPRPLPDNKPDNKPDTPQTPKGADLFSDSKVSLKKEPEIKKNPFRQSEFDEFWSVYPRKIAMDPALKNYKRALRFADAKTILNGARQYADRVRREGTETKFIQHPKNWLSAKGWKDPDLQETSERPLSALQKRARALTAGY
jgi:hypothetical protein